MEETTLQPVKLPIEKEFIERLKIFFMCARSTPNNPIPQERFIGIVAYRPEDAMARAQQDFASNPTMQIGIISHGDFAYIDDLFRTIHTEQIRLDRPTVEIIPPKPIENKVMGIEVFKASLIMASKEYVTSDEDKKKLEEIIQKIKI